MDSDGTRLDYLLHARVQDRELVGTHVEADRGRSAGFEMHPLEAAQRDDLMQAAAQCWCRAGLAGSIVNIVAGIGRGMPGTAHTCAARAGVIHLAKTVAIEWAPLNIRVNCVAPGIIATNGMSVYSAEALEAMPQTNLMKRFGEVQDIANAVCLLAGDGGRFVTGEVLHVDGGNHIWGDLWTIPKPDYFKVDK